jgi:hypothetical protein
MGWRGTVPLRGFAEHVLPWLWVTFGIAVITGLALFFCDPCMSARMLIEQWELASNTFRQLHR